MKSVATAEPSPAADARSGRVLVIGYGSPIRGDDAIGPIVADRLMDEGLPARVQVVSRHVLTPELVGELAESDLVIFLDASEDGPVGQVHCRELLPAPQAAMSMGHFLDPREMLAWARDLYDHQPPAYLVSVRGETFDFSSYELSPEIQAVIEPMIRRVRELIGV
jgi:hydrogenase maturation protease